MARSGRFDIARGATADAETAWRGTRFDGAGKTIGPMSGTDVHNLQRFVDAQRGVYAQVVDELRRGRKTSHWIWFVFPQLAALGRSAMARRFGIASRDEALAYWRHPVLGMRLKECTGLMLGVEKRGAVDVLGPVDAMKFRSSMTLFDVVAPDEACFAQALQRFFDAQRDALTLAAL